MGKLNQPINNNIYFKSLSFVYMGTLFYPKQFNFN